MVLNFKPKMSKLQIDSRAMQIYLGNLLNFT